MHYDVFNGDADGIFALHQLRLAAPVDSGELITGVKRDIGLLNRIAEVKSSTICVFDISMDKNSDALTSLLERDNSVLYIDHHFAGEIPASDRLKHHIEPSAQTCTSLIVNTLIEGRYARWAVCGAFGDNLHEQATELAQRYGVNEEEVKILQAIGEYFNYNGYGAKTEDLHFHPADLYRAVIPYTDPLRFYESTDIVGRLSVGYDQDMARAAEYRNLSKEGPHRLYHFPGESWARRIAGVFSNMKARENRDGAHAIIVENDDTTLQVSVRAPLSAKKDADTLCRQFPTGGGRAAAAGINHLPVHMLDEFISSFHAIFNGNHN